MDLNKYQKKAAEFAVYPQGTFMDKLSYTVLGLNGEAGEVAEKVKKAIRDSNLDRDGIIKELGDVLWYLSQAAREVGIDLNTVAKINLKKLARRKERGTLKGSGDAR